MSAIQIVHGDNVEVMRQLNVEGRRFVLAYLDPPFFSQRDYSTDTGELAFRDRWGSLDDYLAALRPAVEAARDLLEPHGSLVLHLDVSAVHEAKVLVCDPVFGRDHFAGQIVWRYRRWPAASRNFQSMHDVLLRYVRDRKVEPRWCQLYEPLAESTIRTFKGVRQHNEYRDGIRVLVRKRSGAGAPDSVDLSKGAALSDVWEIPILAQGSNERTGYPTQKPEALLARLVDALTHTCELVLDPYCGSGTMAAVCAKRDRRCVSIDASAVAIRHAQGRIEPILAQGTLFGACPASPETRTMNPLRAKETERP